MRVLIGDIFEEENCRHTLAVSDLERDPGPGKVSEQDVLDHVLDPGKTPTRANRRQEDVLETIRSLEMLGWVTPRFNESLWTPDGEMDVVAGSSVQGALF